MKNDQKQKKHKQHFHSLQPSVANKFFLFRGHSKNLTSEKSSKPAGFELFAIFEHVSRLQYLTSNTQFCGNGFGYDEINCKSSRGAHLLGEKINTLPNNITSQMIYPLQTIYSQPLCHTPEREIKQQNSVKTAYFGKKNDQYYIIHPASEVKDWGGG